VDNRRAGGRDRGGVSRGTYARAIRDTAALSARRQKFVSGDGRRGDQEELLNDGAQFGNAAGAVDADPERCAAVESL